MLHAEPVDQRVDTDRMVRRQIFRGTLAAAVDDPVVCRRRQDTSLTDACAVRAEAAVPPLTRSVAAATVVDAAIQSLYQRDAGDFIASVKILKGGSTMGDRNSNNRESTLNPPETLGVKFIVELGSNDDLDAALVHTIPAVEQRAAKPDCHAGGVEEPARRHCGGQRVRVAGNRHSVPVAQ